MSDAKQSQPTSDKKPLEIPPHVREFLEGIIKDAGIVSLDATAHEEMIKELFVKLDSYIVSVIVDKLPDEHLDAFMQLNDEGKPQTEIEQFLQDKLPDAQQVFTDLFGDFRDTYLKGVALERNKPSNTGVTLDKYIEKSKNIVN